MATILKCATFIFIAQYFALQANTVWAACTIVWGPEPSNIRNIYEREGGQEIFDHFLMAFDSGPASPPCKQIVVDVSGKSAAQVDAMVNNGVADYLEFVADSHPELTAIYPCECQAGVVEEGDPWDGQTAIFPLLAKGIVEFDIITMSDNQLKSFSIKPTISKYGINGGTWRSVVPSQMSDQGFNNWLAKHNQLPPSPTIGDTIVVRQENVNTSQLNALALYGFTCWLGSFGNYYCIRPE